MAAIGPGQVRLTYLGNAGWEITDGRTVIIVDPFVTQFASYPPSGKGAPRSRDDLLIPDSASIDRHVPRADALIGAIKPRDGTDDIYDYMGRLMRVLGQPKTVLPTHLDAYGDPTEQKAVEVARRVFAEEVRRLSPKTRVIIPTWFEAIVLGSAR